MKKQTEESNGFGIAAMLCGSFSIPLVLAPYFGLPLAILGIVFHSKQKKIKPNGYATAGLVTGIIGVVLNSIVALILIVGMLIFSALG